MTFTGSFTILHKILSYYFIVIEYLQKHNNIPIHYYIARHEHGI